MFNIQHLISNNTQNLTYLGCAIVGGFAGYYLGSGRIPTIAGVASGFAIAKIGELAAKKLYPKETPKDLDPALAYAAIVLTAKERGNVLNEIMADAARQMSAKDKSAAEAFLASRFGRTQEE